MQIFKFIIPFFYTLNYNRKGIEGIAYVGEFYFIPFFYYFIASNYVNLNLLEVFGALVFTVLIYEIGYIQNNVIAIQNEKRPTIRHTQGEIVFARKNILLIILSRLLFSALILAYYFLFDKGEIAFGLIFGGFIILCTYHIYNNIREGILNRVLFFLLRLFRYSCIFLPFGLNYDTFIIISSMGIVSLINNFSWYPERSPFSLPRIFGTKIFDASIFFFLSFVLYRRQFEVSMFFLLLGILKSVLFVCKVLCYHSRKYEKVQ